MGKILFAFLMLLFGVNLNAQNAIKGKVIDAKTKETLAFANITTNIGIHATADMDGAFSFESLRPISRLMCSYVGYKKVDVFVNNKQIPIVIQMVPLVNELEEIIIGNGNNPATQIIRKVIANRESNNPENRDSFGYDCYNKMTADFLFSKNKRDSIYLSQTLKNSRLLLAESVTKRKFLKPDWSEEVVYGTKVSGFKNPTFAALATDLQPFSFYRDYIKLFDIRYLNPIADGSLKKYKFRLEDEIYKEKDTVFILSFKPISGKNFDGLEGLLYINSNQYAVQNVIASPFEKGKIDIKIQQQYLFTNNQYWFPEQLNYTLTVKEYPNKDTGIFLEGKSYLSNVVFDVPLAAKDFSQETVRIEQSAAAKDALFWQTARPNPLTLIEKQTYKVIDSIGQAQHFDRYLTVMEKLLQGRYPLHYADIDLGKTLVYNKYEGMRIGAGFISNKDLFENTELSAFAGYGLKDEKWKYGGGINYTINKKNAITFSANYQDNLLEIGNYGLKSYEDKLYNFRSFLGYRYDRIEQSSIHFGFKSSRYAYWKIALQQANIWTRYIDAFQSNDGIFKDYKNTTIAIYLRYAFGEKLVSSFGNTFSGGTKYPVVFVLFSKGFKTIWHSNFNYMKIEAAAEQSFYTKNFGLTKYRLEGGFINKTLPAGLLFTGDGSYDTNMPFVIKNTFQTMAPYEFLSDRYANLFLSHDFGTLLFKTALLQPNISMHNNIGWGSLSQPENHLFTNYKTKEKAYFETGLKLDNIIKLNFANIGYLGIGSAAFYRYGFYAKPEFEDNIALKITLNFTIK